MIPHSVLNYLFESNDAPTLIVDQCLRVVNGNKNLEKLLQVPIQNYVGMFVDSLEFSDLQKHISIALKTPNETISTEIGNYNATLSVFDGHVIIKFTDSEGN